MVEILRDRLWELFEPGTSVVVDEGPLQGMSGTVLGVSEKDELIVSVHLLLDTRPVALDPNGVHVNRRPAYAPRIRH